MNSTEENNQSTCYTERRTPGVKAFLHSFAKSLLENKEKLFELKALHHGPVHLIFPHIMQENIKKMQMFFSQYAFETHIYYTCKPNKSKVFLKEAFNNSIKVDVSSAQELITALSVGFRGHDIGCTNLKNHHYLRLAMEHDCLISVDNLSELHALKDMQSDSRYKNKCRILLRVANLKPKDRIMTSKISKFGIAVSELPKAVDYIVSQAESFDFYGLHFHHDNPIPDLHAGYIDHALTLMEQIEKNQALPSRLLNIGGGFRVENIEDINEWSAFVDHVSEGLNNNLDTGTWNNQAYGMKLNEKGRAGGRSKLESKGKNKDYTAFLKDVLENTRLRDYPLHRFIGDNLLSVMVEPGASLLGHAGLTLMSVNGTKKLGNCDNAVFVDGNIYNISGQFIEPATDFIHISRSVKHDDKPYDAYIIDNLCNERGVLSQKCMYFDQQPQAGDLMIVPNTASYLSDFEDASPHMHPQGHKVVVTPSEKGDGINFYDEAYYSQNKQ